MYLTIHDGYDVQYHARVSGSSTKQWPISYWNELVRLIKEQYPQIKLTQVGSKTGREITGVDECKLNQTTITECFNILRGSSLHIDGDSGLVHAATRMNTPCVVIFGPTPDYFYSYPQNINLRSSRCKEACYWTKPEWMNKCPIGFSYPKCMSDITPDQVMEKIKSSQILKD